MATYSPPKRATAWRGFVFLVDQSNTKLFKANPTLATNDVKVSIDGGAFANITTLPSATPASGRAVQVDLSGTEMTGDNIVVQFVDAAGAEWCDLAFTLQTTARQFDDLAFPTVSGRGTVTSSAGVGDAQMVLMGASGSGVAQTGVNLGALLPGNIVKNTAYNNFTFLMTDSTNHNPVTGKTVTVTRSIDGGAFAGGTLSAVTEVGSGIYKVNFGAGDLNGNTIILRATATGCDDTLERIITFV